MRATAWHNGNPTHVALGYGIKFMERDRDRYFQRAWETVVFGLDSGASATVALSQSFWRTCPEVRSPEIGQWLLDQEAAPWQGGSPPGIVVTPVDGNRFTARVLKQHRLG